MSEHRKTLAEILGLDATNDEVLKRLEFNTDFISDYKVWCFDKAQSSLDQIAQTINYQMSLLDTYIALLDIKPGEGHKIDKFLKEKLAQHPEDVDELYSIFSASLRFSKKPDEKMYHHLLDAYVKILGRFEDFSTALGFIKRVVEHNFGPDGYLGRKDIHQLMLHAPQDEIKNLATTLFELVRDGLTREDVKGLVDSIKDKDKYRRELHEELLAQGRKICKTELDVMTDIVYQYHNKTRVVDLISDKKEIVVNGGTLMMSYCDYKTMRVVSEGSLSLEDKTPFDLKRFEKNRQLALDILKNRNAGDWRNKGEFSSDLYSQDKQKLFNEDEVKKCFEDFKNRHPEYNISYGFEPSHCAHGVVVYAFNLRIPVAHICQDKTEIEIKLAELLADINTAFK